MATTSAKILKDMLSEYVTLEQQIDDDREAIERLQESISHWEALAAAHQEAMKSLATMLYDLVDRCEYALRDAHYGFWEKCYNDLEFNILLEQKTSVSTPRYADKLRRIMELKKRGLKIFAEEMERDWLLPDEQQKYPHNYPFAILLNEAAIEREALERLQAADTMPRACRDFSTDQLVQLHADDLDMSSIIGTERDLARQFVRQLMSIGPLMPAYAHHNLFYSDSKNFSYLMPAYAKQKPSLKGALRQTLLQNRQLCLDDINSAIESDRTEINFCKTRLTAHEQQLEKLDDDIIDVLHGYEETDPVRMWWPRNGDDFASKMERIAAMAVSRRIMPELVGGVDGYWRITEWQDADTPGNNNLYAIEYGAKESTSELREGAVNTLLLRTLLAFPIGRVHISVVDLQMKGFYSQMLNRLDASLCDNIITPAALTSLTEQLEQQVAYVAGVTSNVLRYNVERDELLVPYHLVILCGCHEEVFGNRGTGQRLLKLVEVGYRYGIHFISTEDLSGDETLAPHFQGYQNLMDNIFPQPYIDYINAGVRTAHTQSLVQPSWQSGAAFSATPQTVEDAIVIPYGEYGQRQTAECIFDDATPQAILIGQTGSGKSYFMHTLLLNAMLRYSADYLELYLMDFKLGAPELVSYRDFPHVSHLLADGSDRKVVYEVLRGLYERMTRRGKMIAERGCRGIRDYNRSLSPGETPMRRILLVVDECHNLFQSDTQERQLQERITNIIERIAAEGRSQGVHFLLGTQTLANTQIPQNVINNISNRFLMMCSDVDAERLVDHGSQKVRPLTQGMVYSSKADKAARIYNYAPFADAAREAVCTRNTRPADAPTFFFSGKLCYPYSTDQSLLLQSRHTTVQLGKGITVAQNDIAVRLKREQGQNILITGINEQMQAERVIYAAIQSFHDCCTLRNTPFAITLIDNFDEDDDLYVRRSPILDMLETRYGVHIVSGRGRKTEIARLAAVVAGGRSPRLELLAILGKERMRRLLGESFGNAAAAAPQTSAAGQKGYGYARFAPKPKAQPTASTTPFRLVGAAAPAADAVAPSSSSAGGEALTNSPMSAGNVEDALRNILLQGPECGVFTVMQASRPGSVMLDEHVTRQTLQQLFCHMVMLQMPDRDAASRLPLDSNVSLEKLPAENDRLRACYYNDETGTSELFIPYTLPTL